MKTVLGWLGVASSLCVCAWGVERSRGDAFEKYTSLEVGSDVYALPQAEQLILFSLGYRAAAADLLFGRTMVAAGVHFVEKRVFEHLDSYLLAILALDPDYRDVYRYSDALLNLSTVEMPPENLRKARDILERGLRRFPDDAELWLTAGQFMAYLAPQRLPKTEDKEEWRREGARMVQQACSLSAAAGEVSSSCLSSASQLAKHGESAAAIRGLERLIAIADDPATRDQALKRLRLLVGERAAERRRETVKRMEELRASDLPSLSRTRYQLMTPPFNAHDCIQTIDERTNRRTECATSFADYGDSIAPLDDGSGI